MNSHTRDAESDDSNDEDEKLDSSLLEIHRNSSENHKFRKPILI